MHWCIPIPFACLCLHSASRSPGPNLDQCQTPNASRASASALRLAHVVCCCLLLQAEQRAVCKQAMLGPQAGRGRQGRPLPVHHLQRSGKAVGADRVSMRGTGAQALQSRRCAGPQLAGVDAGHAGAVCGRGSTQQCLSCNSACNAQHSTWAPCIASSMLRDNRRSWLSKCAPC